MNAIRQSADESMIRVLVADSSRIHTGLLANALKLDPLLEVIAFEANSCGLVAELMAQAIDVLVISSNLDEQPSRGVEVLFELRALNVKTRAILLPDSSKDEAILQAFRAGARGVFGKNEPIGHLSKCVRCVHRGQVWASSEALQVAVEALASSPTVRAVNAEGMKLLSDRELQVVRCIAEGLTNREIAKRLKLSQHTIKNYLFRIFDKVGVSSRVELLFMTLSQNGKGQALAGGSHNHGPSQDESALLKDAAEAGLPAAQLALAQLYLTRRGDPRGSRQRLHVVPGGHRTRIPCARFDHQDDVNGADRRSETESERLALQTETGGAIVCKSRVERRTVRPRCQECARRPP